MTELLPIVFQKGQNESIDARVAPPEVHASAQNVRWRKDGRPAKRYGSAAVVTTPFATGSFNTQPVNAIASLNGVPVLAMGSSVRQQSSLGWDIPASTEASELPKWGPGERDVIARDYGIVITRVSSGVSQGMVLHAWSDGIDTWYSVKSITGATVVTPRSLSTNAADARVISTTNYIYVLAKNAAGALVLGVFNPLTLVLTLAASPGTLDAVGSHFDGCGRGSDFLICYQSTAVNITIKLFTAVAAPALTQTQVYGAAVATGAYSGIASTVGGPVFVAVLSPAGDMSVGAWNNTLTALTGSAGIAPDANNSGQPGVVLTSATTADVVWGGYVAATASSYMRAAAFTTVGAVGTVRQFFGVSLASKPFVGPAQPTIGNVDSSYVWVQTTNNDSTKWDSQRAYHLVKYRSDAAQPLMRQLSPPSVTPPSYSVFSLFDVLNLGTGYGFMTPLLNLTRFNPGVSGSGGPGVDTVTVRSIFESMRQAARDTAIAGRVLQFSGGSLFESGGEPEETGFSNFPVIQSITIGAGGGLSVGNYLYRAVYEWIDVQGRRHRSAPSDPFTVSNPLLGNSATLVMKPLIADSHFLSASGSAAGRGVTIQVYRTLVGQGTYHRCSLSATASGSVIGAATVSFSDVLSDVQIAAAEILYTDGGVADNTLCPPHTFHTICNGRLWVGGQLDRCVITASKILVDGEPTQFSDLDPFSVFLPDKCTALVSIDGTVVAFARERIFFVTGDGPNDQGVGSFNPPTELPTDVGCIDWRSVLETSLGVFFQSKRGIYLLPRGFNTPVFIGAEVESTLADYPIILSSTLVAQSSSGGAASLGELTARFVVTTDEAATVGSRVLVYDLRTGGWSVDGSAAFTRIGMAGSFSDTFVFSVPGSTTTIQAETVGSYAEGSAYIATLLATGDIRPFGVAGYGRFCSVVLVGEFRGSSTVTVRVSVDGEVSDAFAFPVSSADAFDQSVYLDVTPRVQIGSAIRISCSDDGFGGSEGFVMQALFIEHDLIGKTKRLAAARRA